MGTEKAKINGEIDKLLKLFSLQDYRNIVISKLSSGYKQRCSIAGALAGNISLLILDEPGKGLDPRQIVELRDIIRNYSKELTIIISSHILNEIDILCDRVLILDNGEMKYDTQQTEAVKNSERITFSAIVSGDREMIYSLKENTQIDIISINSLNKRKYKLTISISRKNYECDEGAVIFDSLVQKKLRLHKLVEDKNTLEEIFMNITGKNHE